MARETPKRTVALQNAISIDPCTCALYNTDDPSRLELQTRTSESQVGVRRRIHIFAQVDARLAVLSENIDVLGLEARTRPGVGAAEREHLVAREWRQILLVPTRVGDAGTVSRLVRVDVARPVFEFEVLENDRAVVDSCRARIVLVDVGLAEGVSTESTGVDPLRTWVIRAG